MPQGTDLPHPSIPSQSCPCTCSTHPSCVPQLLAILTVNRASLTWYLATPPVYDPQRGAVPNGGFITIRPTSNWTMYCTQDGSDPRLPGGALSPNAPSFGTQQITLQVQKSTTLSCRSRNPDGMSCCPRGRSTFLFKLELPLRQLELLEDGF